MIFNIDITFVCTNNCVVTKSCYCCNNISELMKTDLIKLPIIYTIFFPASNEDLLGCSSNLNLRVEVQLYFCSMYNFIIYNNGSCTKTIKNKYFLLINTEVIKSSNKFELLTTFRVFNDFKCGFITTLRFTKQIDKVIWSVINDFVQVGPTERRNLINLREKCILAKLSFHRQTTLHWNAINIRKLRFDLSL